MTDDHGAQIEILVIGAGFSGICAGIKLREAGITNFRIVEKSRGIGGTWWDNTYPGATCDVPSHFYSFSFAPNPDWSHLYSPQPEIQAYIESCAERFGIRPHIDFGREIASLRFDEARARWQVEFTDGPPVSARFVINGSGGLHRPAWPEIAGRGDFAGVSMHTARWDHRFDPKDKRIAVIGSAASAIQVIPQLAEAAARIDVYQRTANYIAPRGDHAYTARQKRSFARFPAWQRFYRWLIMQRMDRILYPIIHNSKRRDKLAGLVRKHLHHAISEPELREKLDPEYELGCKRILISDDFYATLKRANVDLITDPVARITETGVVAGSQLREVDAIIYATGFDIHAQFTAIDLTGRDGVRLADLWRDRIDAYRGVMIAGFPNYFLTTGPNTGVGTTSVVYMIEQSVGWILRAIRATPRGGTIDVHAPVQAALGAKLHRELGRTVWATECKSWYKRADGRIETLYPGSARAYARDMSRLRTDELIMNG